MRPRYELLQGVFLLAVTAGIFLLIGVPHDPVLATVTLLFGVGGVFALLAGLRVERDAAGQAVDHLTLRGAAGCSLGLAMGLLGTSQLRGGELLGLAIVFGGVFVFAVGIATIQRRPSVVAAAEQYPP
ncbi:hypothetical protein [Halobaculum gomorrense]|uniref:Uncharacterized protein n=1 Tax=Halobaculum gomorrense TaxID=43928 RepID=A0A1M5KS11_9EURY|nr:hypothetical protein [Halobaculum gomorrense]SHG55470.1 hypothetical protein SAMN05443636_0619 [Halobaculum gomorrense]